MHDWNSLTLEALRTLGADKMMVPGAKLRQRMVEVGQAEGFDVGAHVAVSGIPFSKLAASVAGVTVKEQPGSDVLIGLQGARSADEPTHFGSAKTPYGTFRKDVYQAFTRVSSVPYVYLPGSDKFVTEDHADGPAIKVDGPTLDSLIAVRRDFVKTLPQDAWGPLLDALDRSPNPLSEFRRVAVATGAFDKWSAMHADTIKSDIVKWARKNNVTPRDAWFHSRQTMISPHRALTRLIPYLTADEIRELHIPFRAIEALLSDLQER